jgi:hypothetical protein
MTDTPMAVEINCATGQETIRPLTSAEIAEHDQMAKKAEADRAEREAIDAAKADAKLAAQAKLQVLGLTGEEIAAITK